MGSLNKKTGRKEDTFLQFGSTCRQKYKKIQYNRFRSKRAPYPLLLNQTLFYVYFLCVVYFINGVHIPASENLLQSGIFFPKIHYIQGYKCVDWSFRLVGFKSSTLYLWVPLVITALIRSFKTVRWMIQSTTGERLSVSISWYGSAAVASFGGMEGKSPEFNLQS